MAVIQKIRNKYAKVAGFIIALSLVGFILMDAASGRFGDLFGHDTSVAKVNGEKIDTRAYSQRVKDYETLYAYSNGTQNLDDNTRAQINDEALKDLVNEVLIRDVCEKIGIQSTKEEEKDLIYGVNPDPAIQSFPAFRNRQTNMFDPQYVKLFEQQADQLDPTGKAREQWETLKAYVLRTNLIKKYSALVTKNIYEPSFISKYKLDERKNIASIRFVKVPYSTIQDAQVPVKEEELTDYMKKHEAQFRIDQPSRSIEYVAFDVVPTAEDTAKAMDVINRAKPELAAADTSNIESVVNRNSDEQYVNAFVNKKMFMSRYADSILNMPTGSVYGPYFENGSFKITKVVAKTVLPDSVKCRHILVKTKEGGKDVLSDSAAKLKIDSAIAMLNSGADFNAVAAKYSEDDGSKSNGGEYTFTLQQKPGISKEFGDFIFDGKVGEKKTVKVENSAYAGYHYIEILDQKGVQTAAKLATVSKSLFAGDNTVNAVYAKANEFAGKNSTGKAFDEAIKKENLNKRIGDNIKESDFVIPGIGSSREIIRWVYEAKMDEVSPVFQLDGRYVVAKLSGIQEKGLMKLNPTIRPAIENIVRTQKKGQMIADKYKSMNNLDAIASASAQPAKQIDSFNISLQFISDLGYEPKVAGYSFYQGFKPNTMSPAIKGMDGVFFVNLLQRTTINVPVDPAMEAQKKMMAESQYRQQASQQVMDMLRKKADIKYNVKNI